MRRHLRRRQCDRVDRHIRDGAVEPVAVRLGGALAVAAPRVEVPAVEVVPADPPVPAVGLGRVLVEFVPISWPSTYSAMPVADPIVATTWCHWPSL